jgi:hypothetical protein
MLAGLLLGHAFADSVLQPPGFSAMKRHEEFPIRWRTLMLHGAAHALPVALVTMSPMLALAEFVVHPLVDRAKARGWFGMWVDQGLHVACKALWTLVAVTC